MAAELPGSKSGADRAVDDDTFDDANGPRSDPPAVEVVRASPDLADIAGSLLLTMFPAATLFRAEGRLIRLLLAPGPGPAQHQQLRGLLFDLVDRPEWRARHAVAREVSDDDGLRLELLIPSAASDYRGGPALIGPFADERSAVEWGEDHAKSDVSFDTFFTGTAWVCDLFELPGAGASHQA